MLWWQSDNHISGELHRWFRNQRFDQSLSAPKDHDSIKHNGRSMSQLYMRSYYTSFPCIEQCMVRRHYNDRKEILRISVDWWWLQNSWFHRSGCCLCLAYYRNYIDKFLLTHKFTFLYCCITGFNKSYAKKQMLLKLTAYSQKKKIMCYFRPVSFNLSFFKVSVHISFIFIAPLPGKMTGT